MLIDVRTANEYRRGHYAGSVNIPLDELKNFQIQDKATAIRVYCKSGGRSAKAKEILKAKGYTNVVDLGGFDK